MRILVTGTTGYMGGALAAAFLADGHSVLSLGRDDGTRTRKVVEGAARGLGTPLDEAAIARLACAPIDPAKLDGKLLAGLDAVWHVAAHMAYSPMRLAEAFAFNATGTSLLYQAVRAASPGGHFFYCSTAYTGGIGRAPIPEALHLAPRLHNAYLVTKWSAEMILAALGGQNEGLRATLYRPPGVVGHSQNGWYGGKGYGMFNFYDAFAKARSLGAKSLALDIDPEIAHPYLPIDDFVGHALALTAAPPREGCTVLHDLGTYATNRQLAEVAAAVYGVAVTFGKPVSESDSAADAVIAPNKPFNQGGLRYPYAEGRLEKLLGAAFSRHPLDEPALKRIVTLYREDPSLEGGEGE